jgi:hypothetical protein
MNLHQTATVVRRGNITFADSINGKDASFDGKSYIEVNDSDSLDLSNGFTYSLWLRAQAPEDNARKEYPILFKKGDEVTGSSYPVFKSQP